MELMEEEVRRSSLLASHGDCRRLTPLLLSAGLYLNTVSSTTTVHLESLMNPGPRGPVRVPEDKVKLLSYQWSGRTGPSVLMLHSSEGSSEVLCYRWTDTCTHTGTEGTDPFSELQVPTMSEAEEKLGQQRQAFWCCGGRFKLSSALRWVTCDHEMSLCCVKLGPLTVLLSCVSGLLVHKSTKRLIFNPLELL